MTNKIKLKMLGVATLAVAMVFAGFGLASTQAAANPLAVACDFSRTAT